MTRPRSIVVIVIRRLQTIIGRMLATFIALTRRNEVRLPVLTQDFLIIFYAICVRSQGRLNVHPALNPSGKFLDSAEISG